jgi:tetratricopeptide (TPR) repeat protein/KaiC/GvpD/RAD55 family RecA-like ATPase
VYDVFLSYHWRDHQEVEKVARALKDRGLKPFLDRWYLVPGKSWTVTLEKILGECRAVAVFLGPNGMGRWQQREKELALDRQIKDPDFLVIPVLLSGSGDPPLGFLALNSWVDLRNDGALEGIEALIQAVRNQAPGENLKEAAARIVVTICPYRGLRPFREEDESFFCGRENLTERLAEAAARNTVIAVVGASGSGKSSVVRAGLVPRLRRGANGCVWDIATILPQDRPFYSLAACFLPLLGPEKSEIDRLLETEKLANALANGTVKLRSVVDDALKTQPGTDRMMLVVDQWEELYTLCRDEAIRHAFIDQLLEATASSRFAIVLTLRGDFYGHTISERHLSDRLQDAIVNIGPMTREELRRAIVQPAAKVALRFEEGLVERILSEVGDGPGSLPLLEFLLTELWENRRANTLLHDAYDAIGGVRQAIAKRAERAFDRLGTVEKEAAHWALIQLVRPGEGTDDTRRRAVLEELDPTARVVIEKLTAERLLVIARDSVGREVVELGHEALTREWSRLREWVDADREILRVLERLKEEATAWDDAGKPVDLLLPSGRRLAEAEEAVRMRAQVAGSLVRDYVHASTAAEQTRQAALERSRRRLRRGAQAFSVVLVLITGFAVWQWLEASKERDSASAHLRLARDTSQTFVSLITKDLENRLPEGTVRIFLDAGKDLFDRLSSSDLSRDPAFQVARARILSEFGDAYRRAGELDKAAASFEDSLEIFRGLAENDLSGGVGPRGMAEQIDNIANIHLQEGYLQKALEEFNKAFAKRKELALHEPESATSRRDLAWSYYNLGEALLPQDKPAEALESQKLALANIQRAIELAPKDADLQRRLSLIYVSLGTVYHAMERNKERLESNLKSLDTRRRLVEAEPNNVEWQMLLSWAYIWVGSSYEDYKNCTDALSNYQEALTLSGRLARDDPGNRLAQYDLAIAHHYVGNILKAEGNLEEALKHYTDAYEIRDDLVRLDGKNSRWRKDLALSLESLGDLADMEKRHEEALRHYADGCKAMQDLAALDQANRVWAGHLSRICGKAAGVRQAGNDSDAVSGLVLRDCDSVKR